MAGRMFKLPDHNTFSYQPIFYDKKKEELEKQKEKYEKAGDSKEYKSNIKGQFNSSRAHSTNQLIRVSNLRLYTIIGVAFFTFYYITQHMELIQSMISVFFKK